MIKHNRRRRKTLAYLTRESVQFFLDHKLEEGEDFTVIFHTKGGDQRQYTGCLMPSDKRSDLIPFATIDSGVKSFDINRVLSIVPASVMQAPDFIPERKEVL